MKALKIFSVVFVVGGIILLGFWEHSGRELLTYKAMLVTNRDISAGEIIDAKDITSVRVPRNLVLNEAYNYKEADFVIEQEAAQFIPQGSQIVPEFIKGESRT